MAAKEKALREELCSILEECCDLDEKVVNIHGSNEHGIDILLLKRNLFGIIRAYGVQVKIGDITCSRKRPNRQVQQIIAQAMMALGANHCLYDGSSRRIACLYIVTDGTINSYAQQYITSALRCAGNIHFIDGKELDRFRKKYAPRSSAYKET